MEFLPAPVVRTPHEQMVHQCISEHNWMVSMLGIDVGIPGVPAKETRLDFLRHYADVSQRRLAILRQKPDEWFQQVTKFFAVDRTRSWILLRRKTHSAHHRAQLIVYLRLLGKQLDSTYGPTADTGGLPANKLTWSTATHRSRNCSMRKRAAENFRSCRGAGGLSPTERPGS
jgi:hypothetical protein